VTMRRAVRLVGWATAAAALVLVFTWYLNPHFVVDLTTRIVSCF
jgi:hypothetical protein